QAKNLHQASFGLFHLLEFPTPLRSIGGVQKWLDKVFRLGHGAGQVAAAYAELDSNEPLSLFAINRGGPGPNELACFIGLAVPSQRSNQVAQAPLRGQVRQGWGIDHRTRKCGKRYGSTGRREPAA